MRSISTSTSSVYYYQPGASTRCHPSYEFNIKALQPTAQKEKETPPPTSPKPYLCAHMAEPLAFGGLGEPNTRVVEPLPALTVLVVAPNHLPVAWSLTHAVQHGLLNSNPNSNSQTATIAACAASSAAAAAPTNTTHHPFHPNDTGYHSP